MLEALAGIALGFVSGLVPGLHVNNLLPFVAFLGPYFFIPFSIAWLFSSAFPSVLLGVPTESLAVLPGHRLVLQGRGHEALVLCVTGTLAASMASLALLPLLALFLPVLYPRLVFVVPYVLFAIVAAIILLENGTGKLYALAVAVLSSVLGMLTFSGNYLLPLLSGFFGLSTLMVSWKSALPPQVPVERKIPMGLVARSSLLASFISSFFGFLPGVSSGIVAAAGNAFGRLGTREFLAVASAANASYLVFSLFAVSLIGATRSGTAASLQGSDVGLLSIAGLTLFSAALSAMACLWLIPRVIRAYSSFDYGKIAAAAIIAIIAINLLLSGISGLLVLFVSTNIGLFAIFSKTKRINCMASLAVPAALALL